ncbi:Holo-acyl carrier protein synthase:Phosphopantethiene-protein transferase [Shewanella piezotolerans WP3]|uniref:Holo-[acyl-carrier-protein] synthase n=1 Tax=Shewanella piezotolerans (strain WP3 / JCM 13877) TaxID=225849 RepID=ACPS_SHEPW|nr:holo-ACP synthase [Shewanella piezotolerans]B8CQJ1.1 RecName: Full=Holo-[acyl-carrier-protein] synthase; Short=Holo-ACP synthase; AltName: Full=4'-phosphopantetheinyl transferase AcpS [Shewanella piezotolerans WP3]ACJ30457.1 Holo-acyl carrier protein synthase:Phosphopantethiene-protein transferase [Shewanella piezotolerans WP3]
MIVGLGTDIVEIARIETRISEVVEKELQTNRLAKRVLTPSELDIFIKSSNPGRYLAKRFAAKEAAAKALGTGIGRGVSFQHIEISNNENGAPIVTFSAGAAERLAALGGVKGHLSIADEKHYATATVILES